MKNLSQKGKMFVGYAVAGIIFALLSTITTGFLAGTVGLPFAGSVQGIFTSFFSGDPTAIALVALTTIIVGVYVWIFGYIGARIKAMLEKGKKVKLQARPRIIALLIMGAVTVGVLGLLDQAISGIDSSVQLSDVPTFIGAITSGSIMSVIVTFIGYAGLGFLVIWLGGKFSTVVEPLPDTLKKI